MQFPPTNAQLVQTTNLFQLQFQTVLNSSNLDYGTTFATCPFVRIPCDSQSMRTHKIRTYVFLQGNKILLLSSHGTMNWNEKMSPSPSFFPFLSRSCLILLSKKIIFLLNKYYFKIILKIKKLIIYNNLIK